jgi:hypothetical protein
VPDSVSDMPEPSSRAATSRRIALVLVIIMSGLIVLALLGVVWGFIRQSQVLMAARARAAAPVSAPNAAPGAAAVLTLAPGARIVSASTDAGKLVLHVQTASGAEVEIIDLSTGKLTSQVKTAP